MKKPILMPADILLPFEKADLEKWAVVACDQYTSEPEYWHQVEGIVKDSPSTLRMILPEAFLEQPDVEAKIVQTHNKMDEYLKNILTRTVNGYVYIEREIAPGIIRQGLVGQIDLENYSYQAGAKTKIRPSEGTVISRIPPRLNMRKGASLELPHILMLIDDRENTVIEPLSTKKQHMNQLYDINLMQDGGNIKAWAVDGQQDIEQIGKALLNLDSDKDFIKKYNVNETEPSFVAVVGDGNHSLAAAKAYWEEVKKTIPSNEQPGHPARYCLVELSNIQSPANIIEPIHRVLFNVEADSLLRFAAMKASEVGAALLPEGGIGQKFVVLNGNETVELVVRDSPNPIEAGTLEDLLNAYTEKHPGVGIDYVHGDDSVKALVANGAIGILLPALAKESLFLGVALGGVLPKKSFSMGHANQKRYYLESRKIQK